jgi:hypothetical protein
MVAGVRWWLECGPGRAGVARSESRGLSGVGSCLEQGKAILVGGAKAPRASTAGHRGCSRVAEEQNRDSRIPRPSSASVKQ